MKTFNFRSVHFLSILFLFTTACSSSGVVSDHTEHHKAPEAPQNSGSPELKRIKALAGKWRSTTSMFGKKNEEVFTEYTVTAGGSAVVETIFPGTPYEMVSVYFDDDQGKLEMTHYCIMQNRPHFKLAMSDKDKIKLGVTRVEGLKSKDDPSMGAITLHFKDADHYSSTCDGSGKAKGDTGPMTMHFTRVK